MSIFCWPSGTSRCCGPGTMPALEVLRKAFSGLPKRWVLVLAVLLHDLGKVYRSDHEHQGVDYRGSDPRATRSDGRRPGADTFSGPKPSRHVASCPTPGIDRPEGDSGIFHAWSGTARTLHMLYLLTYRGYFSGQPHVVDPVESRTAPGPVRKDAHVFRFDAPRQPRRRRPGSLRPRPGSGKLRRSVSHRRRSTRSLRPCPTSIF